MKKSKEAVAIIGGADGPTSVFVVGTNRRKHSLKVQFRKYLFQRRKRKAEASVVAKPHTLDEVVQYMERKYGAVEKEVTEFSVQEERRNLREALILKYKPELLGELAEIQKPKQYDEASLREFWQQVEARSQRVREIPEELFPMDFHVYEIRVPDKGSIQCTVEKKWHVLSSSYSGKKRGMKTLGRISKEIYLYYGVSERDIEEKSERYQTLVLALSS